MKTLLKSFPRTLEYYEVMTGKPLVIKLDDYVMEFNFWTIKDFLYFNEVYKSILTAFNNMNEMKADKNLNILKIAYYRKLIQLIYEVSKKNIKFLERKKYKKYLKKIFYNDINKLIEIFRMILDYNSSIKKKLLEIQNFNIWDSNTIPIIGGLHLSEYIQTNEKGEKFILPRYSLN